MTLFRHGRVYARFNESCSPSERASAFFTIGYLSEFARCERGSPPETDRPIGLSLQKLNMATLRRCRCPMICGRSQKGQRRKNPRAAGWYHCEILGFFKLFYATSLFESHIFPFVLRFLSLFLFFFLFFFGEQAIRKIPIG